MILKNANIIFYDRIEPCDLEIVGDRIAAVGQDLPCGSGAVLDLQGLYLAPGVVDIHTHGGYGYDFMDNTEEAFESILRFQADHGITSVVASTVTAPVETIRQTLAVARRVMGKRGNHAKLLGVHLEGPYLSFENRGAHAPAFLRVPAEDDSQYITENADIIRQVTRAPELRGAVELTRRLVEAGIVVSLGHDNAILPELLPVVEAGASNLTHIYCAMSGVVMRENKRYVGLREYGLIDDRLTAELIADNHHLTPELVKMIYKCKGSDGVCLISDCLRAGGMARDGRLYRLGRQDDPTSQQFKVADGVAVLADGTRYAGSIQPVSQMLKNVVRDAGIPLVEAVRTVTCTPARIVGCQDSIGSIAPGKCADLCVLDPDLNIVATMVEGRLVKNEGLVPSTSC